MHSVLDAQFTEVARLEPNLNTVPLVPTTKPMPLTVTMVPPAVGPLLGATEVMAGVNLKRSFKVTALVPTGVVTVTCTVPSNSAGDTAVIDVGELTTKLVALTDPNLTDVAPVKPVPVIVTDVPPAVGPEFGLTLVTVGAATNVN